MTSFLVSQNSSNSNHVTVPFNNFKSLNIDYDKQTKHILFELSNFIIG